ncbi:G-box-binding factor 3-like isoform X1 [Typha angustifolia]|uniref:G-box-binding factor 3-like isoform X1 n=1 Tax=Typha angustifolia TaxID=59011 RepID=UPI003C2E631B
MGRTEAANPPNSDKSSSPVQDKPAVHPYPDWAAMQAYYGPGMMPPPYFNPAVAPGHAPHPFMWGPQPLLPPFGSTYAAIYPPGGAYSHPSVALGSYMHRPGVPTSATSEAVVMATPLSLESPAKSAGYKDKGITKKLKGFEGLSVSLGKENLDNAAEADVNGSGYSSAEGSSDGSSGTSEAGVNKAQRKRSPEDVTTSDDHKVDKQATASQGGGASGSAKMSLGVTLATASIPMDLSVASQTKAVGTPTPLSTSAVLPVRNGVSTELWKQDERELKRERRKQSNRESARRSRLRKQAETEELAVKVQSLNAENSTLRSEISQLSENSEKLRLENCALLERLKNAMADKTKETCAESLETDGASSSVVVVNFLSMIDNPNTTRRNGPQVSRDPDSSTEKLQQLLDSNPGTDAVTAS